MLGETTNPHNGCTGDHPSAANGDRETAPPPGGVPGVKEENVGEWWDLVVDLAWALEEVQQAVMSSRSFQLPLEVINKDSTRKPPQRCIQFLKL